VIRVFIIAASPLARAGLENFLAAQGMEVAGSIANVELIAEQISDVEPDVVLIETHAEQAEAVLESIARSDLTSDVAVVVLADQPPPGWTSEALRAGIRAVLPNEVSPEQLVATLQAVASGLLVLHPAEASAVFPAATPASSPMAELAEPLTRREREVLQMLAGGLGNKEIAARLAISEHTVKFHVTSILGKLGAATRTEAVSVGIRRGLVLL
jgi:NarL family two-component system response regulator YdfI